MTALTLLTSLILVVGFHAVYRCTIRGAQPNNKARIPRITVTVRVDIFTKVVTRNLKPQSTQPKFRTKYATRTQTLLNKSLTYTSYHLWQSNGRKKTNTKYWNKKKHFPPPSLHPSFSFSRTHESFSHLVGSLELGSSAPNATIFFPRGSHEIHSAAVHARV